MGMPDFSQEKQLIGEGFTRIAGVDEVGRGALCGPIVAAAVIFSVNQIKNEKRNWMTELDDSKRLTPRQREKLLFWILNQVEALGIGFCSPIEIDKWNIARASRMAMARAISNLSLKPDFILVDGFIIDGVEYPQRRIIGGDRKSKSIAAASIVAKVMRDWIMNKLANIWNVYEWPKNKGYGTRYHYQALAEFGPCLIHRLTFNLRGK
jgi:ribonuclease HII